MNSCAVFIKKLKLRRPSLRRSCLYLFCCFLAVGFLCLRARAVTTTVRVGCRADCPPFQFIDQNGSLAGMHIDLLESIAEASNLVLQYQLMSSDQECLEALDAGRIDLVLGVETGTFSAYDGQYTEAISTANLCLMASNATALLFQDGISLQECRAVYEYGTIKPYMVSSIGVQQYLAVGNELQLITSEQQGKAELIMGVKESLLYQLYDTGTEDAYTILNDYISSISYSILLPKDNFRLYSILNNGILDLRVNGTYHDLYNTWVVDESETALQNILHRVWYFAGLALACMALYVGISTRVRFLLQRKVEERTRDIQLVNLQLEQKIQQVRNESRLRNNIIEASSSGMILFNSAYRVVLANRSACMLAGRSSIPADTDILQLPVFGDILRSQPSFNLTDLTRLTNYYSPVEGGEKRHYRYTLHPAAVEGAPHGALLTVDDVTVEENKKQEIFEVDKSRALNRIVAGIAHEIRNPLMSIRTFASLMKTSQDNPRVQESFAKYVPGEVDRINRLVESLIHYAKPDTSQKTAVNVRELIEECAFLAGTLAKGTAISVESDIPDGDLQIYVNRDRIKQVLINLIMNGIDALREKLDRAGSGAALRLILTVRSEDDVVSVTVYDEGIGMSEQVLNRCTELFFTTKAQGTGLGLSLVQQFVHENGGDMRLDSREGSYSSITLTFRRYLPCSQKS